MKSKRQKTLSPVHPNVGIALAYRTRLLREIEAMDRSLQHWICAAYRNNVPEMAQDDSPARTLGTVVRRLARYWQKRFDRLAPDLAGYFAQTTAKRSDAALQHMLKKGGFSVEFKMTKGMNDVVQATIQENVALIRSIAQQHLNQVEQLVMRSVQAGRDLKTVSDGLQQQLGVAKKRAHLIARDQNNKATGALQRVRHLELGVKKAIWVHSGGGKVPRPTHVKAGRDKVEYDIEEGWFDPHEQEYIFPGYLINCRCVSRPVLPGFS